MQGIVGAILVIALGEYEIRPYSAKYYERGF